MTNLKTFTFDLNRYGCIHEMDVRIVDKDGQPWWIAKDVCDVLGVKDHKQSLRYLDEDEKGMFSIHTPGGNQEMTVVSEPGLYSLILRSRKPQAREFKRWLTHDVIPTIRKTGGTYMTDDALIAATEDPDFMIGVLQKLKQVKTERDEAIRTKAMVAKGREGTLFSKVGNLTRENNRLVMRYENPEFIATTAIPWLKDLFTSAGTKHLHLLLGQELKDISKSHDLPHHKMAGSRYPITLWHRDAIEILRRRSIGGALRPKLKVYLKA